MTKEHYGILLLLVTALSIQSAVSILTGFLPTGWDTYFHMKYSSTIMETARIPVMNPYFPNFALAYTTGAHALVAVLSIVGGLQQSQMLPLFSLLPLIFAAPIILAFYTLARKYVEPKYALLATFMYYFSSLVSPTIIATNGAALENSLAYPYVAALVSFALFPLFIKSLIDYSEHHSTRNLIVTSLILAGITLSYHIMALVAYGLLLTYLGISFLKRDDGKLRQPILLTMILGLVVSLPYLLHIVASGLPVETGALQTYAVLSIQNYADLLHPPLFLAFLFCALLLLVSHNVRKAISSLPTTRLMILVSWGVFLVAMSQAYVFGIFLVNDRFGWYLIAPVSIFVALCFPSLENLAKGLEQVDKRRILVVVQCLLILGTIFSIGLQPEVRQTDGSRNFLTQELEGISWLKQNAAESVVATSPNTGFLISSLTDVRVIAIPDNMADYYIRNLEQRINDIRTILDYPLNQSFPAIASYNVKYVYISSEAEAWFRGYGIDPYQLLNEPYFKPVFPLKSFVDEATGEQDFDGDGVPETFQAFLWNGTSRNSKLYLLTDPSLSTNLTLRGLFDRKGAYGPVRIFVNGVLITEITANETERGLWHTYDVEVPSEVLKQANKVFVENLDPRNNFYVDYIGFGSSDAMQPDIGTLICEVQYSSRLNVGSEISDLNNDGVLDVFDNITANGNHKEYFLYSESKKETALTITNLFPENGTGPVGVFMNNLYVGSLTPEDETQRATWLTQRITIPPGVLKEGWNSIRLVNFDAASDWHVSFVGISS